MKADKVRNLTDEELRHQERELGDQLFKLKFQLNMGQTESLKKIRGLRKDIARVKTICARARTGRARRNGEEVMAETATSQTPQAGTAQGSGRRSGLQPHAQDHRGQVMRKKSHPFYCRVVSKAKKFYAHDEKNEAHIGDVVRLEETRPLSKLKRWRLKEIVRQTALVPEIECRSSQS